VSTATQPGRSGHWALLACRQVVVSLLRFRSPNPIFPGPHVQNLARERSPHRSHRPPSATRATVPASERFHHELIPGEQSASHRSIRAPLGLAVGEPMSVDHSGRAGLRLADALLSSARSARGRSRSRRQRRGRRNGLLATRRRRDGPGRPAPRRCGYARR
jgi:hypothetical protein